jgi:hypothetical protein
MTSSISLSPKVSILTSGNPESLPPTGVCHSEGSVFLLEQSPDHALPCIQQTSPQKQERVEGNGNPCLNIGNPATCLQSDLHSFSVWNDLASNPSSHWIGNGTEERYPLHCRDRWEQLQNKTRNLKFSNEIFLLVFHLCKKVPGDLHRSHSAAHHLHYHQYSINPTPLVVWILFFLFFCCTWHISVLNGRLLFLSMCWTMGELFLPFQYFRKLCNGFF